MIDPKNVPLSEVIKSGTLEYMKGVYTSIPGHIVTFNPSLQRAQVQIGIQRVLNNGATETPWPIDDVPVIFHGGDYTLEFEVGQGTEGAMFFSQRCIDGWKNSGGVAANPLSRFFHPQDCYFVPGLRSQPSAISNFANNGIRIRNKSGNQFAWLKNDGSLALENGAGHIRISSAGVVSINGVTIQPNGNTTMPQNLAVAGALKNADVNVGKDHKHSGVQTGNFNTGNPV